MASVDARGLSLREVNGAIRAGLSEDGEVVVVNPESRHNLAVGLSQPGRVLIDGNVGYYCGGMLREADIEVTGNAGWSVASDMQSGSVVVRGNASAAAGAAMRGGTLVVHGSTGPRTGISQKGGTIVIGGSVDYMSGFVSQKGLMVVCGDTGEAFADSIYEGRMFAGGDVADLGNGSVFEDPSDADRAEVADLLARGGVEGAGSGFRKIVSDRRLFNFDKRDFRIWRTARGRAARAGESRGGATRRTRGP